MEPIVVALTTYWLPATDYSLVGFPRLGRQFGLLRATAPNLTLMVGGGIFVTIRRCSYA
jgi:hypothetical protein